MAAPTIEPYPGETPQRTQAAGVFSDNVDDWLTWLTPMVPEMNASVDFVNTKAEETDVLAQSTANVANTIVTASNFKGEWASLTGALTVPSTLYHDGTYWQLLVGIPDVTASEPGLLNTDYALSAQAGDHVIVLSPFTLTVSGRYYVLGSDTVTVPDPTTLADGQTFNFKRRPNETPTIFVGTDLVTTRLGLTDGILMGVSQHEMIVYDGLYEV